MDPEQNRSSFNPMQTPPIPSVPPPPPTEVNLRTMNSDIKSIQEQGGAMPTPETVSPLFQPKNNTEIPKELSAGSSGSRRWLLWFLLLAVLAFGGFYYYWFYWQQPQPAIISETGNPTPVSEQTSTPSPAPFTPTINLNSLNNALQTEASKPMPSNSIKEVLVVNENSQPVPFSKVLSAVLPEITNTELVSLIKNNFEDNFKVYLYYDDKGVWPIYGVKMKANAAVDVVSLKAKLMAIENASVSNFYLIAPGVPSTFKDGQISGMPTRYQTFSQPGASFNYGLIDSNLIFSTSYNGLKKLLAS